MVAPGANFHIRVSEKQNKDMLRKFRPRLALQAASFYFLCEIKLLTMDECTDLAAAPQIDSFTLFPGGKAETGRPNWLEPSPNQTQSGDFIVQPRALAPL